MSAILKFMSEAVEDVRVELEPKEVDFLLRVRAPFKVLEQTKTSLVLAVLDENEREAAHGRGRRSIITAAGSVEIPLTDAEIAEQEHRAEEHRLNTADPLRRIMNKTNITPMQKVVLFEQNFPEMKRESRESIIERQPAESPKRQMAERIEALAVEARKEPL